MDNTAACYLTDGSDYQPPVPDPQELARMREELGLLEEIDALPEPPEPVTAVTPLPDPLPPVEPFVPELLPKALSDYVVDVAKRIPSVPPDFVAVSAICALAGVVGCRIGIKPKQRDEWVVVPNQWGALIGRPSAGKTPAINEAMRPVKAIEAEETRAFREAEKEHQATTKVLAMQAQADEKQAKKLIAEGKSEQARVLLMSAEYGVQEEPARRRIIVKDATVESLGELLSKNPTGLLLERDELTGWLARIQREDAQEERAFFLEGWNGNGTYTVDRIGRGHIAIPRHCVSIIGGIQPSKLEPLVRSAVMAKADDGLIQRFQLAVWPDDRKQWQWVDRYPAQDAKKAYSEAFNRLWALPIPDPEEELPCLRFTPEAQALFIRWSEEHQAEARSDEHPDAVQSHLLKMDTTMAGLALLFELVQGGREAVGVEATLLALAWSDYLKSHANRIYSAGVAAGLHGARLLLRRKDKLPDGFKSRDIKRKGWTGLTDNEVVSDALDILCEHGYLIERPVNPSLGRPTVTFAWNRQGGQA